MNDIVTQALQGELLKLKQAHNNLAQRVMNDMNQMMVAIRQVAGVVTSLEQRVAQLSVIAGSVPPASTGFRPAAPPQAQQQPGQRVAVPQTVAQAPAAAAQPAPQVAPTPAPQTLADPLSALSSGWDDDEEDAEVLD